MKYPVIDNDFLNQIELLKLSVKDNIEGRFGGNHKSKKYGSSLEFADFKEYIPGDDIKKIDWSVFARTDSIFLKLFFDERQLHTRIYIDASESMNYYKKGEKALKLAASLAYLSINFIDKVSIYYVKSDRVYDVFENIVGKDSFLNSIGLLNNIDFSGESKLDNIISSFVGYGDGNSIIISDFLSDENFENVIDYLRNKKRDVFCIQLLSKEEIEPDFRGKVILYDSENKKRFYRNDIDKNVIKAYKEAVEYATKRVSSYCSIREANYLLSLVDTPLEKIFFEDMFIKEIVK